MEFQEKLLSRFTDLYHVWRFLTYNVRFLGVILNPPIYPKIGRHQWTFPLLACFTIKLMHGLLYICSWKLLLPNRAGLKNWPYIPLQKSVLKSSQGQFFALKHFIYWYCLHSVSLLYILGIQKSYCPAVSWTRGSIWFTNDVTNAKKEPIAPQPTLSLLLYKFVKYHWTIVHVLMYIKKGFIYSKMPFHKFLISETLHDELFH